MSKKSEILRIWQECFPGDSPQWRRMFFDSSYVDEEALTEADPETGATVSSLLLLPYSMTIADSNIGAAYIYGAGTLRKFRAKGHMGRLLKRALREAADRGDSIVMLIPASETLRGYYRRFGFESVFYRRPMRYTAIHRFPSDGEYVDVSSRPAAELFPAFERLTENRDYYVRHTRAQFLTAMEDVRLSATGFAAVARADDTEGTPVAMAWGRCDELADDLYVTELIAEDSDAANAAIMKLKEQFPDRPVTILSPAADSVDGGNIEPTGMARIVNPEPILSAIAAKNPALKLQIRLSDPIIEENNAIYTLKGGKLTVAPDDNDDPVDLDVDAPILSALLFSSAPIAAITGLPAHRPQMSLMLD
ncbi:MAG: GNAT family N-acetyltransferase [Muribaculaceae bacterium]|nr:GNAT family N-acetyltransferase [Muribaculaceae bacterium]